MPDINNAPGGIASSVSLTDRLYVAQGINDRSVTLGVLQDGLVNNVAVPQFTVAAGNTLALTRAQHQGATIILAGAGATVSLNATTEGDGFACKIINDTGSDWTVPTFTGATARYDAAGQTKVVAGGSAGLETYTRASTRYVHIVGTTA